MQQTSKFGSLIADGLASATGLTLGLVAHPDSGRAGSSQTLARLEGTFSLELLPVSSSADVGTGSRAAGNAMAGRDTVATWRPRWTVWLHGGDNVTAEASTGCVVSGIGNAIKATYNVTSKQAILFVNNTIVAKSPSTANVWEASGVSDEESARASERPVATSTSLATLATASNLPPIYFGAEGPAVANGFGGSLEEIYLKNVSTENRVAYVYTDNVRPDPNERVYV